jgi:hypothetical protein
MPTEQPLVLSEMTRVSGGGTYRTDWHCQPPPLGVPHQVLHDEWIGEVGENDITVRSIYEIRVHLEPGQLYVRLTPWLT